MELLLFYVLAYYGGDLNKSVFELADKYYITEAKASRLLVEISKRYRKPGLSSNVPVICDIAARVFAGGGAYRQNITVTGRNFRLTKADKILSSLQLIVDFAEPPA